MPRPIRSHRSLTSPAAIAVIALLLACATSSCNSQSFQQSPGPSLPVLPPVPEQAPPAPINVARMLNGNWMATYPGGPLRVVIGLDPMLRGRNYVATLVDGNKSIPPGQVVWKGKLDPTVPGIVIADQICAEHGFLQARWVQVRILVHDPSNFREELVNPSDCHGFPVRFTRIGSPPAAPLAD